MTTKKKATKTAIKPMGEVAAEKVAPKVDFINDRLIALFKGNEGLRLKLYRCPAGKLTIGYGRNVQDNGITKDEAELMMLNDLKRSVIECISTFPNFKNFSEPRRNVLIDMVANMGKPTFLEFDQMIAAINRDDWVTAGAEMMDSIYARQNTRRAKANRKALVEG